MTPRLQISEREWAVFRRDAAALKALTDRTAAEFYNTKAYMIVRAAIREDHTKRASRSEIEALGLKTASHEYVQRSGFGSASKHRNTKFKFDRDKAVGYYIAALIHHRGASMMRQYLMGKIPTKAETLKPYRGKKSSTRIAREIGVGSTELAAMARRWIGKKLRSIGFLASTWRPILRKLDRYSAQKGNVVNPSRAQHHAVMSFAKPATERRPIVEFGNVIGADKYGNPIGEKPQNLLMIAFRKAWFGELRSQAERLRDKLKEAAKKSGATVR